LDDSVEKAGNRDQLLGTFERVEVLKGHGFSRAAKATKRMRALAPEGMLD
jgi:hypothetical protein